MTPLSTNHLLRGYINAKAFNQCSHDVAECVSRALTKYTKDPSLIHCFQLFRETYEKTQEVLDIVEPTNIPKECKEQRYDEWIWNKFKEMNNDEFNELNYAIQICMDNMVIKKIKCKEQLLEHFFMHKLRHLLLVLPDIHKEHTEKKKFENGKSLGSVPQHRIDHIRQMAGLQVKEEVYISFYDIDELYN